MTSPIPGSKLKPKMPRDKNLEKMPIIIVDPRPGKGTMKPLPVKPIIRSSSGITGPGGRSVNKMYNTY